MTRCNRLYPLVLALAVSLIVPQRSTGARLGHPFNTDATSATFPTPRRGNPRFQMLAVLAVLLTTIAGSVFLLQRRDAPSRTAPVNRDEEARRSAVKEKFGKLPLYFVENQGQTDPKVAYYIKGRDKTVYFTSSGLTFALSAPGERTPARAADSITLPRRHEAARSCLCRGRYGFDEDSFPDGDGFSGLPGPDQTRNGEDGFIVKVSPFTLFPEAVSVSAASYQRTALAPEMIVAAFGIDLATGTAAGGTIPLPTNLLGATVTVTDSGGTTRLAQLFLVSPG